MSDLNAMAQALLDSSEKLRDDKEQENYTRMLMAKINQMNQSPLMVQGANQMGFANLSTPRQDMLRLGIGTETPVGNVEVSRLKNPYGYDDNLTVRNDVPIASGMGSLAVEKNLLTPEARTIAGYSTPVAGGQMQLRSITTHDNQKQKTKELEAQYLRQINKNMAIGVYGSQSPYDNRAGLKLEGRF
jgi:hypothetical protein